MTVKRNYALACSAGSYALTGTDVTFTIQPGANIQYTEIYPITRKAVTSVAFSGVLRTRADFAGARQQVITMATYAELSK